MTQRNSFKDTTLQAQFARDGYLTAPMLDADQVASLLAEYATLRPADGFTPDGSGIGDNTYHFSLLDEDSCYRREAHDLILRYFTPVLDRYLLDNMILMANFSVKPAGCGEIPVHQNWPVLPDQNDTSVVIWCPLVDADVSNGTLHVAPGSHKLLHHIEAPNSPSYFARFEDRLYDNFLVPVPLPAGSGAMFDDGLMHGSPANLGDAPRVAVQITCVPAESKPVFFFRDEEQRFELIDAPKAFYLENNVGRLYTRQPEWRGRGHFKSRNRQIDEAEFRTLLADGENIRRKGFEPLEIFDPVAPPPPTAASVAAAPAPLWRRVARRIKRTLVRAA